MTLSSPLTLDPNLPGAVCVRSHQVVPKDCEMVILADTPIEEREVILQRKLNSYGQAKMKNLRITHVKGNPCSRTDVMHALNLGKARHDLATSIVVVAEDR